jgi:hypothetical protein
MCLKDLSLEEQYIASPILSSPMMSTSNSTPPFQLHTPLFKHISSFKESTSMDKQVVNNRASISKNNGKIEAILSIEQPLWLFKNSVLEKGFNFAVHTKKQESPLKITFHKRNQVLLSPDKRLCDDEVNKILSKTTGFKAIKEASQELQTVSFKKQHDHENVTMSVMGVQFQPYYTSTHGLSRPCSPVEDDANRERYHKLLGCISEQMISELPAEWMRNIENLVLPIFNRSIDSEEFLKRFYDDLTQNYCWSIKKAIIDYLLMDLDEQKRLGIRINNKVSTLTNNSVSSRLRPSSLIEAINICWLQQLPMARSLREHQGPPGS